MHTPILNCLKTQYHEVAHLMSQQAYTLALIETIEFVSQFKDRLSDREISNIYENHIINHFGE